MSDTQVVTDEMMIRNYEDYNKFYNSLVEMLDRMSEGMEFINHKYADTRKIENMMCKEMDNFRDILEECCGAEFNMSFFTESLLEHNYKAALEPRETVIIYINDDCYIRIEFDIKNEHTYMVYPGSLGGYIKYNKEIGLWRTLKRTESYRIY